MLMKQLRSLIHTHFFGMLAVVSLLLMSGCNYEYSSPLPGLIDVRLRVISNNIAFDPTNNFVLKVTSVEAVRDGDFARAPIYEDTKAIGRTTNSYNTFILPARDSALVLGVQYLPPADYVGINLLIEPGDKVILDGYRNISVYTLPEFNSLLTFRSPFHINEQVTTSIVITIDLDQSLVKLSNTYVFVPVYWISSIK